MSRIGAKRRRPYRLWLLLLASVVLAQLASIRMVRAAPDGSDDPSLLSTLTQPYSYFCAQDVSNEGHYLYVACASRRPRGTFKPSGPAKLFVYDISDLRRPRQISETTLDEIGVMTLIVRGTTAFLQEPFNASDDGDFRHATQPILMIDVHDPTRPPAAGQVDMISNLYFRVSDDGSVLALRNVVNQFKFFDTSDPYKPTQVSVDRYHLRDVGDWRWYHRGQVPGIDGVVDVVDTRDDLALVDRRLGGPLLLYKLHGSDPAALLASLAPDPDTVAVNIVPGVDALVFGNRTERGWVVVIRSAVTAALDSKRLLRVYDDTAKAYAGCGGKPLLPACTFMYNAVTKLAGAGIERLIDHVVDGISPTQRVLMLNNYGLWLYQWLRFEPHALRTSARMLQKVVELSPDRSVAWLNRGNTLRALIPLAETENEKANLWRGAESSYARYKGLSGKEASEAAELGEIDLPQLVRQSKNVCDYVAGAYNRDSGSFIASPAGTVAAEDGTTTTFVVGWVGGSCAWPTIKTAGCESEICHDEDKLSQFHFAGQNFGAAPGSIVIVPFHGKYYTVAVSDHAPVQVIDPISGPVCRFERQHRPILALNENPALCQRYLDGQLGHNANWSPVPQGDIRETTVLSEPAYAHFDRSAIVPINGKEEQIAHFSMSFSGGCGCDQDGVAFIGNHALLPGEPNKSLIDDQQKWWSCDGADADLIRTGGQTYIDAWAGKIRGQRTTPRVLLQISGDKVRPVCRIERVRTVRPLMRTNSSKN